MEQAELCAAVEAQLARSQQRYEEVQNDSFHSHVQAAELDRLKFVHQRLQEGESGAEILAWLKKDLPEIQEMLEQEGERPSFDWYDEHYQYKRLLGHQSATLLLIGLLEGEEKEQQ